MVYKYSIPVIPSSLNKFAGRQNVWEYRVEKQEWKRIAALYCNPKPIQPIEKAIVTLTYYFKTAVRHDPDNYSGKPVLDGLVSAGILKDDSFNCIELRLKGGHDKAKPRLVIEIQEVQEI